MKESIFNDEFSERRANKWAVAIFLPKEFSSYVSPLREKFDPDYDVLEPHITIVFPFESNLPLEKISAIMRDEIRKIGPLEIELESIGDFYPLAPIIYWTVKDNPQLNTLYKSLYAQLDLALPHKDYVPHVTIAREISPHRVLLVKERIVPYLPSESFKVESIDLISPVAGLKWVSVRTFKLPEA